MRGGFTLMEVLVALFITEVAALGVMGSLVIASETMRRAETLEHATARAEGVLDSLRAGVGPGAGERLFSGGKVAWLVDPRGVVELTAVDVGGRRLLELRTRVAVDSLSTGPST